MGLARQGRLLEHDSPLAAAAQSHRSPPPALTAHRRTEVPLPPDATRRALRLEALLADPHEPANPYGYETLTAADAQGTAERAGELRDLVAAEFLPVESGGHFVTAGLLVRALRPLLRRDAALGHACAAGALLTADGGGLPAPYRAHELAPLLGPAALTAAAGSALRGAVRAVVPREEHEPFPQRWRASLAAAFADLLACESLTTVALRTLHLGPAGGRAVRAAAGCVVPLVVGDVLDEVVLALAEYGYGSDDLEMRLCAKVAADVPRVAATAGIGACQADLMRAWPSPAGGGFRLAPTGTPAAGTLFRPDEHTRPADADRPDLLDGTAALLGVLAETAAGTGNGTAADADTALARLARRLMTEHRMLSGSGRTAGPQGAPPAARALAHRHALLMLACSVLGILAGARPGGSRFLARPSWALLALSRVTQRLGVPLAGLDPDLHLDLAAELLARLRQGIDCDLHASRALW
ncbi:hypothetical protein ACFW93_41975 [Streptomyces canus]|uniref:hypothetical protein n=1 Tax=Streptomyces canus TaxID=58343 RepID=UPI0036CA3C9B